MSVSASVSEHQRVSASVSEDGWASASASVRSDSGSIDKSKIGKKTERKGVECEWERFLPCFRNDDIVEWIVALAHAC